MTALLDPVTAVWREADHPRIPGGEGGGEFTHKQDTAAWARAAPKLTMGGSKSGGWMDYPDLTKPEVNAIGGYLSVTINQIVQDACRDGTTGRNYYEALDELQGSHWAATEPPETIADKFITPLDSAIAKDQVRNNSTVYRGVAVPASFGGFRAGQEFTDHGYASTTTDEKTAREFAELRATGKAEGLVPDKPREGAGAGQAVFKIRLRKGQHALRGQRIVREIVLPRGLRYRVVSVSDGPGGVQDVELEIMP
jgi:ADP-ribosyltransferase exoenzyme